MPAGSGRARLLRAFTRADWALRGHLGGFGSLPGREHAGSRRHRTAQHCRCPGNACQEGDSRSDGGAASAGFSR
ncbi:hypothetical protein BS78_K248700 [Paspalum vaginatum]|nr:hypothetical protein BS78_K248700 [Paspalum vaginatum]